ncbi:MAG TPA: hypothetical protein VF210_03085 [Pseudomonadales bacterium]
MVPELPLILLGGGFAAAFGIAAAMIAAPERLRIYAQPNARSFHARPTPTSGGLAFVLPITGYLVWLAALGSGTAGAIAAGGASLALIGLLDDRWELPKFLRLVVQLVVAGGMAWVVLQPAQQASAAVWWLAALVALALAWQINLYNFMDGIDGLAAAQALLYAIGAQVIGGGLTTWVGDLLWLAAGASLGFLALNWPPARLFMGDVGSYFLGLLTGVLTVLLWRQDLLSLPVSLILLSGFWFDASYTLIVRASTRQAFTQPHRTHLYQKIAAKRGHLWTTVCYLVYGAFWLLPLSWMCARSETGILAWDLLWVLPAVMPMAIAAACLGAGRPEPAPRDAHAH